VICLVINVEILTLETAKGSKEYGEVDYIEIVGDKDMLVPLCSFIGNPECSTEELTLSVVRANQSVRLSSSELAYFITMNLGKIVSEDFELEAIHSVKCCGSQVIKTVVSRV